MPQLQEPELQQEEQPTKPAPVPQAANLFGSRRADVAVGLLAAFLTPFLAQILSAGNPVAFLIALVGLVIGMILLVAKKPAASAFFKTYMALAIIVVGISVLTFGACGHM